MQSSREQKKQQTRQAFFDAVLDLCMAGQSFASISLRQVTREVGVVPTAFYRHFSDMEELGSSLVEEQLGEALSTLREALHIGRKRSFDRQIAKSIRLYFTSIDTHPRYWQFLISERYGGSEAVRTSVNNQVDLFAKMVGNDLALQPAFEHISESDRHLLAEAGLSLFLSWVIDWLDMSYSLKHDDKVDKQELRCRQQSMLHSCTRKAQMLFYGAENWKSTEVTDV